MLIAKISVTGVRAASTKLGTLTSGMVGAKVQFSFDSHWDGLNKTAVFRCMDITKDVLNIDSEVTIPHEALVRSGSPLYAGVYGTNADGDLVIPTRWATVGIVYSGADPSGDPSTERSPDVWEQLQNQINELKNQGADADAIKQAVDAYMAANPPAESDPTVPEWAKQPQKPKYTASEVGALASDELQNAVNVALTHAKESGAFDGPQGPAGPQGEAGPAGADGKDGQPGADGKDYVLTESDKTEIAEQAAGLVEVPKPGGIEVTGASVGQIIVVKAVDENGKPTEWECADLPSGGGSGGGSAVDIPTTLPNPNALTFTGAVEATYDGSEAVTVDISQGGGDLESAAEAQLATGTIATGTESQTHIDTGVTFSDLMKYKRFLVVFRGASNVGLANTYLTFNRSYTFSICRASSGGWVCGYEWLNRAAKLFRMYSYFEGNPSLVLPASQNYVHSSVPNFWSNSCGGNLVGMGAFDFSQLSETETLKIYLSSKPTIDYQWEIRGLTV